MAKGLTSECLRLSVLSVKVKAGVEHVFGILFFQAPSSDFVRTDSPIREAPYSPTIQPVSSPNTEHSFIHKSFFYLISSFSVNHL